MITKTACSPPRKGTYKTINKLPDNLKMLSKDEFYRHTWRSVLRSLRTLHASSASDALLRAMYYELVAKLVANSNGKLSSTGKAIMLEIDGYRQYVNFELPTDFKKFLVFLEEGGYFELFRQQKTLTERLLTAGDLLHIYLDMHESSFQKFLNAQYQAGEVVKSVFSKLGTWAMVMPLAVGINDYLMHRAVVEAYGDYWKYAPEEYARFLRIKPYSVKDALLGWLKRFSEGDGWKDTFLDIASAYGGDKGSAFLTGLIQAGILRSALAVARIASRLKVLGQAFSALAGGLVGFVAFTAIEWLLLEPTLQIFLGGILEHLALYNKIKKDDFQFMSKALKRIFLGEQLTEEQLNKLMELRHRWGDEIYFMLAEYARLRAELEKIYNLKNFFETNLGDKILECLFSDCSTFDIRKEYEEIIRNIQDAEKGERIILDGLSEMYDKELYPAVQVDGIDDWITKCETRGCRIEQDSIVAIDETDICIDRTKIRCIYYCGETDSSAVFEFTTSISSGKTLRAILVDEENTYVNPPSIDVNRFLYDIWEIKDIKASLSFSGQYIILTVHMIDKTYLRPEVKNGKITVRYPRMVKKHYIPLGTTVYRYFFKGQFYRAPLDEYDNEGASWNCDDGLYTSVFYAKNFVIDKIYDYYEGYFKRLAITTCSTSLTGDREIGYYNTVLNSFLFMFFADLPTARLLLKRKFFQRRGSKFSAGYVINKKTIWADTCYIPGGLIRDKYISGTHKFEYFPPPDEVNVSIPVEINIPKFVRHKPHRKPKFIKKEKETPPEVGAEEFSYMAPQCANELIERLKSL